MISNIVLYLVKKANV